MSENPYFSRQRKKEDWRELQVSPDMSLRDVIAFIDQRARQIALVTDPNQKLLGTITDGDIRRGILRGLQLDAPCREVMFTKPTIFGIDTSKEQAFRTMKDKGIDHIPLVNDEGVIQDLFTLADVLGAYRCDNSVVIMAGGMGTRLGSLTRDLPKPMIEVGGKPILQTIIENFIDQGFHRFHFSVNYLAEVIKDHFGDGSKWNVSIDYIHEEKPLGTAGALGLTGSEFDHSIIVMNGDLLTNVNFQNLLQFHKEAESMATMCVREFDFEVPYGVVHTKDHHLVSIEEKPIHRFFINAGIYALEPKALEEIPEGEFFNMTHLFERLIEKKLLTSTFPIHEYWKDIGQIPDLQRALTDYPVAFPS
jgi:dTDP-glucose pyrophosphorylase